MKKKSRSQKGNILALIAMITCCVLVPIFLIQSQIGLFVVENDRVESVIEGACLTAANDISKIILNDNHFGYVSLSNYPPVGKATLACDGEPLPVSGINTLVGTIRQNTIIANSLQNSTMKYMVEKDRRYLNSTIKNLNFALGDSVKAKKTKVWTDIHGNKIDPYASAHKYLKQYLPKNMKLRSMKLSMGWLTNGGGSTTIKFPEPERLAYVKDGQFVNDEYKPFINIPAFGKRFTFAGVSTSSRIVESKRFRRKKRSYICSIIKLDCKVERTSNFEGGLDLSKDLKFTVCCQPFCMPDSGPKGAMTLRFTGTPVAGLTTWRDFLDERTFQDRRVAVYRSIQGDYPVDPRAKMVRSRRRASNTSSQFSEHLYCWLRNGNQVPRIDSVLAMTNEFIKLNPNEIQIYEFSKDGTISRRSLPKFPFPRGFTSDNQVSVTADTRIQGGISPIIIFKNNVRYLGTKYGGKHGGQPVAGLQLNWCESHEFGGDEFIARKLEKGRLVNNISVAGTKSRLNNLAFSLLNGKPLAYAPRRTIYSGGLALDIEIGGTNIGNAKQDVVTMMKLPR